MKTFLTIEEVKELQQASSTSIVLIFGETADGDVGYAYILLYTHKLNMLADAMEDGGKNGPVDITELGRVLHHGTGHPPKELQQQMYEEWLFGFTHTNVRFYPVADA